MLRKLSFSGMDTVEKIIFIGVIILTAIGLVATLFLGWIDFKILMSNQPLMDKVIITILTVVCFVAEVVYLLLSWFD